MCARWHCFTRFALGVLACLTIAGATLAAPLQVRGAANLHARATREASEPGKTEFVLSGALTDDLGAPLAKRNVSIQFVREGASNDGGAAEYMQHAHICKGEGQEPSAGRVIGSNRTDILVTTDDDGRFCLRLALDPTNRYRATLSYAPSENDTWIDGTSRALAFDPSRREVALRFEPAPRKVSLDAPHTTVEVLATFEENAFPRIAPSMPLRLSNERGVLATGTTDRTGRIRFELAGRELGPPGPGEFRLDFDGDNATAPASVAITIERHVTAALRVPAAERGTSFVGSTSDPLAVVVEVSSRAGPVGEGSVEARMEDRVLGTAPVESGVARLALMLEPQEPEALVRLRYIPASPWVEPPAEDPSVSIKLEGPSLLKRAGLVLVGLSVLALFLGSRLHRQPRGSVSRSTPQRHHDGASTIELVRARDDGIARWTGIVVDAHDGTPIGGATVWVERPGFDGTSILASTHAAPTGRFTLECTFTLSTHDRMAAEARLHARVTQPVPALGEVAITLAVRKRALLRRLAMWAKKKGPPLDVRPEATPHHVRATTKDEATARWADAVERAAFGPEEVDAAAEATITRLEPQDIAKRG